MVRVQPGEYEKAPQDGAFPFRVGVGFDLVGTGTGTGKPGERPRLAPLGRSGEEHLRGVDVALGDRPLRVAGAHLHVDGRIAGSGLVRQGRVAEVVPAAERLHDPGLRERGSHEAARDLPRVKQNRERLLSPAKMRSLDLAGDARNEAFRMPQPVKRLSGAGEGRRRHLACGLVARAKGSQRQPSPSRPAFLAVQHGHRAGSARRKNAVRCRYMMVSFAADR